MYFIVVRILSRDIYITIIFTFSLATVFIQSFDLNDISRYIYSQI